MPASLSVVVPAFNARDTIGEAIESVLRQSIADLEIIVIDDGSTDDTFVECSAQRDPRVRVVRTSNRGVGAARNSGLRLAESPLVCFLDADDALTPDFAERMMRTLGTHDFAICGLEYCSPLLEGTGWLHTPTLEDCSIDALLRFNQLAIGGVLFRRSFLLDLEKKYGTVFPEGGHAEDWEFFLRCADAGAEGADPITLPLYRYRTRPETRSDGLEPLWSAGKNLIARWSKQDTSSLTREWTVRMLARAAIAGKLTLCRRMMLDLEKVSDADIPSLAGSLRWSTRRARVSGRAAIGDLDPLDSALQLLDFVGLDPGTREQLRVLATVFDWGELALSVARRLAPGEHLVVFGFGRNGHEAARALDRQRIPFSVIDDRVRAAPQRSMLAVSELRPHHVVLVTPDDRRSILQRLTGSPARVLTAESLTRPGGMAA